ncbi:hypothetical protein KW783_01745 [Candidatus Parcubacteria bacterium]|nr:hypothetical protein [Candidatus Parcubacteria bacterium]
MNKQKGFVVPLIIIIVLLIGGIYFLNKEIRRKTTQIASESNGSATTTSDVITYVNQKAGYQIDYPKGFVPTYSNIDATSGPNVSYAFPESFTKGTNLSTDSAIKVETVQAKTCNVKSFFADEDPGTIKSSKIDNAGVFSQMASSTGAAAGNRYEKVVFAAGPNAGMCYGVQLFIHTSVLENYPAGTVKAYDRAKIDQIFDKMLSSFKFVSSTH